MNPTLIGSAAYARRERGATPSLWLARSPKTKAPPAAAESWRNALRELSTVTTIVSFVADRPGGAHGHTEGDRPYNRYFNPEESPGLLRALQDPRSSSMHSWGIVKGASDRKRREKFTEAC